MGEHSAEALARVLARAEALDEDEAGAAFNVLKALRPSRRCARGLTTGSGRTAQPTKLWCPSRSGSLLARPPGLDGPTSGPCRSPPSMATRRNQAF